MKKKAYYAHFMGIYNTPQEEEDLKTIKALKLKVVNPNKPDTQQIFQDAKYKHRGQYLKAFDEVFGGMVRKCDVFIFRGIEESGKISGGVYLEYQVALKEGKIIIELPTRVKERALNKWDTIELLNEYKRRNK